MRTTLQDRSPPCPRSKLLESRGSFEGRRRATGPPEFGCAPRPVEGAYPWRVALDLHVDIEEVAVAIGPRAGRGALGFELVREAVEFIERHRGSRRATGVAVPKGSGPEAAFMLALRRNLKLRRRGCCTTCRLRHRGYGLRGGDGRTVPSDCAVSARQVARSSGPRAALAPAH